MGAGGPLAGPGVDAGLPPPHAPPSGLPSSLLLLVPLLYWDWFLSPGPGSVHCLWTADVPGFAGHVVSVTATLTEGLWAGGSE